MTGRPRNQNREPATKFVRLTPKQWQMMLKFHEGKEPYGDTINRALLKLEELGKKIEGLVLENEALTAEVRTSNLAFDRLFNVHRENKKIFEMFGINPAYIEVPNK